MYVNIAYHNPLLMLMLCFWLCGITTAFFSLKLFQYYDLFLCFYVWEHFLNIFSHDGSDEYTETLITLARSQITKKNDKLTLQMYCNRCKEYVSFISVYQFAICYCDSRDVCCLVLCLNVHSIAFMPWDGGVEQLTVDGGWVRLRLHGMVKRQPCVILAIKSLFLFSWQENGPWVLP